MENFNTIEMSNWYIKISQEIGDFLSSLNVEYVKSCQQLDELQKSFFAFGIIKTLLQNSNLLNYLNQNAKQDLLDTIATHVNKYINVFIENDFSEVEIFKSNILTLLDCLKSTNITQNNNFAKHEFEIIGESIYNIVQICRTLFAEQAHNQEAIDKLQVATICFNLLNTSYQDQIQLFDKLLLVKELFILHNPHFESSNNPLLVFHLNISKILHNVLVENKEDAFDKIITIFVDDYKVLESFSNEQLITLYDRIKNIEFYNHIMDNLLHKLHQEAQFRYSDNRIQDSDYELLKRFQSYDAILRQIEMLSFSIVESFLLRNNIFIAEIITLISKHIDNIKILGHIKAIEIVDTLNLLKHQASIFSEDNEASLMFSSIESKLNTNLDSYILKRYSDLSQFNILSLKAKYVKLFQHIKSLINKEVGYTEFLKQTTVRHFAQDYYVPNSLKSIDKLKVIKQERQEIVVQLSEIDFVEIFSPEHLNRISNLNFRKQLTNITINSASDYVYAIIRILIANLTASQLESLYRPLIKTNLSKTQIIIKQELIKQIKQRTTLTKMIFSLFKGGAKEVNKLKNMKNYLHVVPSYNDDCNDDLEESLDSYVSNQVYSSRNKK